MLVWPRKYTGNQRGSSSATIDSRNRLKSIFSCFYGRCSFDPDANRHTHKFFFHMTLPIVEGTWFNHQILRKHLILDENTKPHQFLTSLINWYSSTASVAVHQGTSSNHQISRKHLILDENTKPHQFLTSLINWYSSTATLAVHQGTSSNHQILRKHLIFFLYRKCSFDPDANRQTNKQPIFFIWPSLQSRE